MMRPLHARFGILLLAIVVGCTSQQAKQSVDRENAHLRFLSKLYLHASQQGRTPKSEQEFKQFIAGFDAAMRDRTLAAAGVSNTDELFISERDGLPYVVLYGTPPKGVANGVIAYEQQGAGGRRYVGFTSGIVEDVDELRFDTLVPKAARGQK